MFVLVSGRKCSEAIRSDFDDISIGFIILFSSNVEGFSDFDLLELFTCLSINNHQQIVEHEDNNCLHFFFLDHEEIKFIHELSFWSKDRVIFGAEFLFEMVKAIPPDDLIDFIIDFLEIWGEFFSSLDHPRIVRMDRVSFFDNAVEMSFILSNSKGWFLQGTYCSDLFLIIEFITDLTYLFIFFFEL